MRLTDYVVESIANAGVRHVFMLPGGAAMYLNESVGRCERVRFVSMLHEQACAIAAEAYAKYDNRLGVVVVTAGPGATNAITGVAGAWLDSTPVLFLSGQVKRADLKGASSLRNKGPQEVDIVALVRSITKYAVTVVDPESIRFHVEKAMHLALSGRRGPVWIELPLDVQAAHIEAPKLLGYEPEPPSDLDSSATLSAKVSRTIDLLNQAERPFVLLGNGIRLASSIPEMRRVLDLLDVPFGLTWPAMDLVPDDHPRLVGRPGSMAPRGANFALQNSDLLLVVGARMDLICTAYAPERLARGAKKIMVDIDSAELTKLEPFIDVPVCADIKAFMCELLAQADGLRARSRSAWKSRCAHWKTEFPVVLPEHRSKRGLVSMYHFAEVLCNELPEGALVVPASSGNAIETLLLAFKAKLGQRIFNTTGLGPMGFGLPASIGACLAHGGKQTVCVDGDGGFQMNIQELETITRLRLPVKLFVINNCGYASIVTSQAAYFKHLVGSNPESGLTLPDTLRIAAAYGLPHSRISNQMELHSGMRAVLACDGPHICEVMVIPDEPRLPRASSYQKADGSMASKPLEDLFPFLSRDEFLANMIIPPLREE